MKNKLIETIRKHETDLLKTQVRASRSQLDKLIADNFIEFGSSGNIYDKKMILDDLPEERAEIRYKLTDFKIEKLGKEVVLATYRLKKASADEKKMTPSLRSSIWKKTDGQWQMMFHQGTKTK